MAHLVHVEELIHNLCAECITSSPGTEREFVSIRVWITPDQVCHRSFVGDLAEAVDDLDLIDRVDGWREASVYAEDVVIYDDRECKEVEHVCEVVPDIGIAVFAAAFSVEAVRLGDAAGFMIAADEGDAVRES